MKRFGGFLLPRQIALGADDLDPQPVAVAARRSLADKSFVNPTPIKVASYDWKMIHCGIKVTLDELLRDGISVT